MKKKEKNKAAVELARLRHIKSPKPKEYYVKISKLGVAARKKKREDLTSN